MIKQTAFLAWWRTFAPSLSLGAAMDRFNRAAGVGS